MNTTPDETSQPAGVREVQGQIPVREKPPGLDQTGGGPPPPGATIERDANDVPGVRSNMLDERNV